ncbi:MAG: cation transporter [Clostridiaceae bacterium]|jgi:cation transport ATPase|nr:cation transporter [Clostridiaceae bacterium]
MKYTYRLENLDCANCAAKMERELSRLDGVSNCAVSFMFEKLTLDYAGDVSELTPKIEKAVKKVHSSTKVKPA